MSSPLLDQIHERRGLVCCAACAAHMLDACGQFVIEASFAIACNVGRGATERVRGMVAARSG